MSDAENFLSAVLLGNSRARFTRAGWTYGLKLCPDGAIMISAFQNGAAEPVLRQSIDGQDPLSLLEHSDMDDDERTAFREALARRKSTASVLKLFDAGASLPDGWTFKVHISPGGGMSIYFYKDGKFNFTKPLERETHHGNLRALIERSSMSPSDISDLKPVTASGIRRHSGTERLLRSFWRPGEVLSILTTPKSCINSL